MADEISGQQGQVGFAPERGHHPGNSNHVSFVGVLDHYQAEQVCFDLPQDYQQVVPEQLVAQQVRFDPGDDYRLVEPARDVAQHPPQDYHQLMPELVVAQQGRFDPAQKYQLVERARVVEQQVRFDPQEYWPVEPDRLVTQQVRFDPVEESRPVADRVVAPRVHSDTAQDYRLVEPERVLILQGGWPGEHFEEVDLGYVWSWPRPTDLGPQAAVTMPSRQLAPGGLRHLALSYCLGFLCYSTSGNCP